MTVSAFTAWSGRSPSFWFSSPSTPEVLPLLCAPGAACQAVAALLSLAATGRVAGLGLESLWYSAAAGHFPLWPLRNLPQVRAAFPHRGAGELLRAGSCAFCLFLSLLVLLEWVALGA